MPKVTELQVNGTRRRDADSDRTLLSVADGRGFGIAAGFEKGGYGATCAEVQVDPVSGAGRIMRARCLNPSSSTTTGSSMRPSRSTASRAAPLYRR